MRFIKIKSVEKPLSTPHKKNKKSVALACIGMSLIFMLAVFMSGCVVHDGGHGKSYNSGHGNGHGKGHGKGHRKGRHGKLKIKPEIGVSVSPMIVIE